MQYFFNGIFLGLTLAILVGPIIFVLLQTAIDNGFKAGLIVATGVWFSDILFVIAAYFGVSYIVALTEWSGFERTIGTIGGICLIVFGLYSLLKQKAKIPSKEESQALMNMHGIDAVFYETKGSPGFSLWLKGFIINTFNPFTVFFWTGVAGTMVSDTEVSSPEIFLFFCGIFLVLIGTDVGKVWAAKALKNKLNLTTILKLQRISGIALFTFGVILLLRVYFL